MEYEITTGTEAFYANMGTSLGLNNGICEMDEQVSRDDLQKAVEKAIQRYPYYKTRAVIRDGKYLLMTNDKPVVVYEQEEPIAPGDPAVNDYLVCFGCWEKTIHCNYFAGLAGGRGIMALLHSVLYYYCLFHYNEDSPSRGLHLYDEAPLEDEYVDPYSYVGRPEHPVELLTTPDCYVLPEARTDIGAPQMMYTFVMPQDAFMKYTKDNDGSPAVIASLFLCKAIEEVHPEHDKDIAIYMPLDASGALGCDHNMQNCLSELHLTYSRKLSDMPFDLRATSFRGMSFIQSDPDRLLEVFGKRKALYERVAAAPSIEDKRVVYMIWAPRYVLPSVSYVGKLTFGDIDRHRGVFYNTCDASVKGIISELFTSGDDIIYCMACGLKTDAYYKAFLHQLDEVGIPYTVKEPFSYLPMKRRF